MLRLGRAARVHPISQRCQSAATGRWRVTRRRPSCERRAPTTSARYSIQHPVIGVPARLDHRQFGATERRGRRAVADASRQAGDERQLGTCSAFAAARVTVGTRLWRRSGWVGGRTWSIGGAIVVVVICATAGDAIEPIGTVGADGNDLSVMAASPGGGEDAGSSVVGHADLEERLPTLEPGLGRSLRWWPCR